MYKSEPELTEQDLADIEAMKQGDVPFHTCLEVWSQVLGNVEKVSKEKVQAHVANKIVHSWPKISFQETPRYHALYHEMLLEAEQALKGILKKYPKAFKNRGDVGAEDSDAVANRDAYVDVMFEWNMLLNRHEHAWDAAHPESHIQIAVFADAFAFLLGEQGLIQHLGQPQVGFQFTEADQQALQERLQAAREEL